MFARSSRFLFSTQGKTTRKTGTAAKKIFTSVYFPIKRLPFSEKNPFQEIYRKDGVFKASHLTEKRRLALINFSPLFVYGSVFMFHFDFSYAPHYIAMSALALGGWFQTFNDYYAQSGIVGNFYINEGGDRFRVVLRKSIFSARYNKNLYEGANKYSFEFALEDIKEIKLLNEESQKARAEFAEKMKSQKESMSRESISMAASAAASDKLNQGREKSDKEQNPQQQQQQQQDQGLDNAIVRPDDHKDTVVMVVQSEEMIWPMNLVFELANNELPGYNDYLIAMGRKCRLINRKIATESKTQ